MNVEETDRDNLHIFLEKRDTNQFSRILIDIVPGALKRFADKNREYGDDAANDLGIRGQFADIYKKIIKMRRIMWDGDDDSGHSENLDEILDDCIAHMLLTKDMLRQDRIGGYHGRVPPLASKDELLEAIPGDMREESALYNENAHNIRESKGGPETWVDAIPRIEMGNCMWGPDDEGVIKPPRDYHGQHSYMVAFMRPIMAVKGYAVRVALEGEEQCGWIRGEISDECGPDRRCVGIAGHGSELLEDSMGVKAIEPYHVNGVDEAWPVTWDAKSDSA